MSLLQLHLLLHLKKETKLTTLSNYICIPPVSSRQNEKSILNATNPIKLILHYFVISNI